MDSWQDISTAPRDGTAVLVQGGDGLPCVAVWENRWSIWAVAYPAPPAKAVC